MNGGYQQGTRQGRRGQIGMGMDRLPGNWVTCKLCQKKLAPAMRAVKPHLQKHVAEGVLKKGDKAWPRCMEFVGVED